MGEVVELGNITLLDIPPDKLLRACIGKLDEVVIVGFTKEGKEWFSSSKAGAGDVVFHLERAKYKLMKTIDDMVE